MLAIMKMISYVVFTIVSFFCAFRFSETAGFLAGLGYPVTVLVRSKCLRWAGDNGLKSL
jgi:hypothetical protein